MRITNVLVGLSMGVIALASVASGVTRSVLQTETTSDATGAPTGQTIHKYDSYGVNVRDSVLVLSVGAWKWSYDVDKTYGAGGLLLKAVNWKSNPVNPRAVQDSMVYEYNGDGKTVTMQHMAVGKYWEKYTYTYDGSGKLVADTIVGRSSSCTVDTCIHFQYCSKFVMGETIDSMYFYALSLDSARTVKSITINERAAAGDTVLARSSTDTLVIDSSTGTKVYTYPRSGYTAYTYSGGRITQSNTYSGVGDTLKSTVDYVYGNIDIGVIYQIPHSASSAMGPVSTASLSRRGNGSVDLAVTLSVRSSLTVRLYDASGRLVAGLLNGNYGVGRASVQSTRKVVAGKYVIDIMAGSQHITKKVVLD
jgi:hypothetical protein